MVTSFNLFRWIKEQQKSEGVTPGEDVYIILRLDGRVRRSGKVSFIFLPMDIKFSLLGKLSLEVNDSCLILCRY